MATITDVVNELITLTNAGTITWTLTGDNSEWVYFEPITNSKFDVGFYWTIDNNSTSTPNSLLLAQNNTVISSTLSDLEPLWLVLSVDTLNDIAATEQAQLDAYYDELLAI